MEPKPPGTQPAVSSPESPFSLKMRLLARASRCKKMSEAFEVAESWLKKQRRRRKR
jgi:hypothetical protein